MELLAFVFMLVVSAAYLNASSPSMPMFRRILVSAHGVVGASLLAIAVVVAVTGNSGAGWRIPYMVLFLLPVVLIGISLILFRGKTGVHMLQFPFLIVLLYSMFISLMLVSGSYL